MAETSWSDLDPAADAGGPGGVASRVLAAVVALSLIGAAGLWVQRLAERDPMGIPVIQALDMPMKRRPEDPEGLTMGGAELAVTRMLTGADAPGGDGVAPPPPAPRDGDRPRAELMAGLQAAGASGGTPARPAGLGPAAGSLAETPGGAGAQDAAARSARPEAGAAETLRDGGATPADADTDAAEARDAATDPSVDPTADLTTDPAAEDAALAPPEPVDPPDATALAPRLAAAAPVRPARRAPPPAAVAAEDAVPSGPGPGDWVVQLGAMPSTEVAVSVWEDRRERHADLLEPYGVTYMPVDSGGRVLHRVRLGPLQDRAAARALCAAIKGRGDDCLVARMP